MTRYNPAAWRGKGTKRPSRSHWGADQTRAAREAIIKRDGPNCWLCELAFKFMEKPTLDHVIPLSLGGPHRVSNMKLAHYSCNTKRGIKPIKRDVVRPASRTGGSP